MSVPTGGRPDVDGGELERPVSGRQGARRYEFEVEPGAAGERLDVWLSRQSFAPSRAFVQRLIDDGRVRLRVAGRSPRDGRPPNRPERARARHKVTPGERFSVEVPPANVAEPFPESIPLRIVYEDSDVVVVDKPRGMVVHAGAGRREGTLVNALLARYGRLSDLGGELRPGIVHRLDKETTGLLVAARNDAAYVSLARQMKERSVARRYVAIVRGRIPHERGRIEANVGRHPVHRNRMAVLREGGRAAVTHFVVMERLPEYTLVEVELETGRTHQIRVHMAHIGFPVAGDPLYGGRSGKGKGSERSRGERGRSGELGLAAQALHAWRLGFAHPRTGVRMEFAAPPPPDVLAALSALGSARAGALSREGGRIERGTR